MSSISTHAPGSRLVSGQPAAHVFTESFVDDFDDLLAEAIVDAMDMARIEIQEMAYADPEWAEYADLLDIEFVDGEFHYILTGEQERIDQALELEYGGDGRSPNSILRKLAIRQPASMARVIEQDLAKVAPVA